MIDAESFIHKAQDLGFSSYTGVPCSYLKHFISCVISSPDIDYVPVVNEGDGIAFAAGVYLGGQYPVVMLQNSGLGNAVNPITSLLQNFEIPILILVTLRGDPASDPDEPQHRLMGQITCDLLNLMGISWSWFPRENSEIPSVLEAIASSVINNRKSYALVIKKNSVKPYPIEKGPVKSLRTPELIQKETDINSPYRREEVLRAIIENSREEDLIIATTGYAGRELYAIADNSNHFYMVGSMGCAVSIGLGLAKAKPKMRVIVIDGDGALLMRLGAMTSVGYENPDNLIHVLLDNGEYESTGAQKTVSNTVQFCEMAMAAGYSRVSNLNSLKEIRKHILPQKQRLSFLYVPTQSGTIDNLPRQVITPPQVASRFKKHIQGIQ